ncbi:MAG: hypothetical protein KDD46_06425 [Bdellovibrionales bacterium]|nr:hypothetical protein [Bdellovibrionales bacterium]
MGHVSPTGYEKSDVNVKKVVVATVLPAIAIILCLIGLDQYMTIANEKTYYDHVLGVEDSTYKELVQKETETLNNYKVIDKQKGIVRLPIQRAMQLIVQENQ